jgi:hypothetical protein
VDKVVETRAEQLARSEELFSALFEQASDGNFFFNNRRALIMANESLARLHSSGNRIQKNANFKRRKASAVWREPLPIISRISSRQ